MEDRIGRERRHGGGWLSLTRAIVALVAGAGDLGGQVEVVPALFGRALVGADADHAPGEAGQVAHLVVQDAPPPLGHVGQAAGRLLHQVAFDGLPENARTLS